MDRRTTLKWMFAAAATVPALQRSFGADAAALAREVAAGQKGYGTDPDLVKEWRPGGPWPLTLTESGRLTVKALCDLIIPADDHSPAASDVGVVDFIDEWLSAPYPQQRSDRELVLPGLKWLDEEAQKRFGKVFAAITDTQRSRIADDICSAAKAKPAFAGAAKFFAKFRDLTAGGFYTTPVGMKDIGYVGNTPLATFEGPPIEALKKSRPGLMLDYESWDRIADAVNPTVGVITLALSLAIRRPGNPPRWAQLLLTLAAVASVYAVGWLDARFGLWSAAGLDFSTHAGVYVAIVTSLWMIGRWFGVAGTVIALLYGALMLYQKYHSFADIAVTAAVIAPLALGIWLLGRRAARN